MLVANNALLAGRDQPGRCCVGAAPDRPLRVLVLVSSLDVGGAEMDLVRSLPRLDRRRFDVRVWAFSHPGTLAPRLIAAGIPVVGPTPLQEAAAPTEGTPADPTTPTQPSRTADPRRRLRKANWLRTAATVAVMIRDYARLAWPVARYMRRSEIDVVHTILPNAYAVGMLANLMTRRRALVMSRFSLNWYQQDSPILRFLERRILHRRLDLATGNSQAILRELADESISDHKLRLVYNGIDAARFEGRKIDRAEARALFGAAPSTLVLSVVANLFPYKGHADLIEALRHLRQHRPDFLLLAAGRDVNGHLAHLDALCRTVGIADRVRFLGQRLDVPVILSAADIHVSASHTEGFPNNILEAMCAGLPVVATAVGGVPEMVDHDRTGLLVPPRSPALLADAIRTLADDDAMRQRFAAAGAATVVQRFTIERTVTALEDVYCDACGSTAPARLRQPR